MSDGKKSEESRMNSEMAKMGEGYSKKMPKAGRKPTSMKSVGKKMKMRSSMRSK